MPQGRPAVDSSANFLASARFSSSMSVFSLSPVTNVETSKSMNFGPSGVMKDAVFAEGAVDQETVELVNSVAAHLQVSGARSSSVDSLARNPMTRSGLSSETYPINFGASSTLFFAKQWYT